MAPSYSSQFRIRWTTYTIWCWPCLGPDRLEINLEPPAVVTSFFTLFVTIGPTETAVIFAGLTSGIHHDERRSLALRSVAIAGLMLLLFAVGLRMFFGGLVMLAQDQKTARAFSQNAVQMLRYESQHSLGHIKIDQPPTSRG